MFYGAVFVEFVIATYLSYTGAAIVNTVLAGCAFTPLYFSTETPYFLIMKGQRKKAELRSSRWTTKNWAKCFGGISQEAIFKNVNHVNLQFEGHHFNSQFVRDRREHWSQRSRRLLIINILAVQKVDGERIYNPVWSSQIYCRAHFTIHYWTDQPKIIGTRMLHWDDHLQCLLVSADPLAQQRVRVWEPPVVYIHNMFFALLAPAKFALKGELLPFSVRAIGCSMTVVGHSTTSLCVNKMFFPITETFGMEWNFAIYVMSCVVGAGCFYFVLPETRGKSLHELQRLQQGDHVILDKLLAKQQEENVPFA